MTWRELTLDDTPAVEALRADVLATLGHPDEYVREQQESRFVEGHLGEVGRSFGMEVDGELAAYCALTTDLLTSGEAAEFAACDPGPHDVVLAAAMVAPRHRGRSLHRSAIDVRLEAAAALGAQRALVQVSPFNSRSLASLFAASFRCVGAVTYSDDRSRLLLTRTIGDAPSRTLMEDVSLVDLNDFDQVRSELSAGRQGHGVIRSAPFGLMVVSA
ncbi:hypothetical protein IEQ44_00280 [Nocardioides sp. Y6]|uniref:N-acetyltransferase domain-containing protein n=1 Tax=Nocardioides malaquae TaxID=2773426 RepID=A0ABR9RPJ5_9ACTN|nr:GNAT family N-acetyltransferase [Nocardioides malaquae]MBE7323085.1 hypothetical protein [Nocardioides malaquae]